MPYVLKNNFLYSLTNKEKYYIKDKKIIKEIIKKEIIDDDPKEILSKERKGLRDNLDIQITGKCNLRCAHCYLGEKKPEDIPFKILKKVFDSAIDLGIFNVVLTGGEPLLHKDFMKIINYLNKNRFRITLVTNGTLINKKILNFINGKIYEIVISLDGFKEDYEKIRGYNFNKIIKNIHLVKDIGINFKINAILHKNLIKYYKKFSEFIKNEFDCPLTFLPVACSGFAEKNLWVIGDYEKIGKIIRDIGCYQDKTNCKFYYKHLAIDYKGFIYPCQFFREIDEYRLGNIFEENLKEVVKKIDELRIIPKTNGSACKGCRMKKVCGGGCRGRAMAYNFDPNTPDPVWHSMFLNKKIKSQLFPKLKNPLYEKLNYNKYPLPKKLYKKVEEVISNMEGKRFLDIGCGNGRFLKYLASKNPEHYYCGIDSSEKMIKEAQKNKPKNVDFKLSTIQEINEKYDVAMAIYSFFNHFKTRDEIQLFFDKIRKIVKWFVFDTLNYELFKKESVIKEKFNGCYMVEYVKQTADYVYSFRKYNYKNKKYYYAMSWPKIDWDKFLKQYGTIKKEVFDKRILYILKIG